MSKVVRDSIDKAGKLIAKEGTELEESILAELKRALQTVTALADEHRSLKASIRESGEVLEASAKDLGRLVQKAKKAASASSKAKEAVTLAEKATLAAKKRAEKQAATSGSAKKRPVSAQK